MSTSQPTVLLSHHLKALRLPVFLREYEKIGLRCVKEKQDYAQYLLQLCELELIEREKRGAERRCQWAR